MLLWHSYGMKKLRHCHPMCMSCRIGARPLSETPFSKVLCFRQRCLHKTTRLCSDAFEVWWDIL